VGGGGKISSKALFEEKLRLYLASFAYQNQKINK